MGWPRRMGPGVLLALALALVAQWLSGPLGALFFRVQGLDPSGRANPVSGIAVAVLLGLLVSNTVGTPAMASPGLSFALKKLLRLGIILVGIKLSVVDVLRVGGIGVPVVLGVVVVGMALTLAVARAARLSPALGSLFAASTAICGITATLAVAPTVEAQEREVAYAVANVTLFGLVAMLVYPYLAQALFAGSEGAAGLFLGTAIHDTAQVMGAALSYQELFGAPHAAEVATVTKLTRNAFLVLVVPTLALLHARRSGGPRKAVPLSQLFPLFVLGFVALALLRTLGDATLDATGAAFGVLQEERWSALVGLLGRDAAQLLLGVALAAVGLTTRFAALRVLGLRPLAVGFAAALTVGALAALLAWLVGPLL